MPSIVPSPKKPIVPQKPASKKSGTELSFEKWEDKLPWVKKYRALVSKEKLSENDCNELPDMRRLNALETHLTWAKAEKADITLTTLIPEKFQTAVNHIVSKFCEPLEEEYTSTIERLQGQPPQRNDHELLDDTLKAKYVAAATVRYRAATSLLYNPKSTARNFSAGAATPQAEHAFINKKEELKQRYIDGIKRDKRLLQDRFSELLKMEDTLVDGYGVNEKLIIELKTEIVALIATVNNKCASLAPVTSSALPHAVIITGSGIPAPPPPPPLPTFLLPPPHQKTTLTRKGAESKSDSSSAPKEALVFT